MGARQLKQARYADKISTVLPKEIWTIRCVLKDSTVYFGSYNNRSIENVVAIRESFFFRGDKLRVVQKYSKNIKSFTDTRSLRQMQDLDDICEMESLEELRINLVAGIHIDKALEKISRLKNLKSLYLNGKKMGYDDLVYMVKVFPNLESFQINVAKLGAGFLKEKRLGILSMMKNLKELKIYDQRNLNRQILGSIVKNAPNLTKLTFELCYFEDKEMWKVLENLHHLKHLNLNVRTSTGKYQFFCQLPTIPTLESFNSPLIRKFIKKSSLGVLAEKYPNLKEAHYGNMAKVGDEFVLRMIELWKDLRVVDLSSCNKDRYVTILGIEVLVKHNPNIHTLDLRTCSQISDKSLIAISTLRELKELKLDNCDLSTRGLVYLGKLKKLERLFITSNSVTNTIILKFLKTLKLFVLAKLEHDDKQHIKRKKQKRENIHEISHILFEQ